MPNTRRCSIPGGRLNRRQARKNVPTEVVVALIAGGFSVIVALIGRLMRQNKRDHGDVARALGRIEGKLDAHVDDHRAHG